MLIGCFFFVKCAQCIADMLSVRLLCSCFSVPIFYAFVYTSLTIQLCHIGVSMCWCIWRVMVLYKHISLPGLISRISSVFVFSEEDDVMRRKRPKFYNNVSFIEAAMHSNSTL